MPDPTWPSSPPEVNHLRLIGAGAGGTATTTASGTAWQAATVSSEAACSVSVANTMCTIPAFEGVGGAASAASATDLNGALHLLATWAQEKVGIAAAGVSAYQTAVSAMIPAEVSIANRTEQAADVALNPAVFGALTPAIIALDTVYFGEHWPHNAAVGVAYGAALTALTAALAIPPALLAGSATAAPASAAGAAADAAGQLAAGEVTKVSNNLGHRTDTPTAAAAETLALPLSQLAAPVSSLVGPPQAGMFQAPLQTISSLTGAAGGLSRGPLDQVEELGDASVSPPIAGLAAMPSAIQSGAVPACAGSAGAGSAGAGSAGAPVVSGIGSGVASTVYAKPATAFPAESGGRPVGLKGAEPLSARQQPLTTAGMGVAPAAPAAKDRSQSDGTAVARTRVLLTAHAHAAEPV